MIIDKIKKIFQTKLHEKIYKELYYQRDYGIGITPVDGKDIKNEYTFSNNKCHCNSLDLYKRDKTKKVVIAWTYDNDSSRDHYGFCNFINYDVENDVYIDNTLGGQKFYYNYFIIESTWLDEKVDIDNINPGKLLAWFKEDMYNKYCTNWFWRKFIKVEDM